MTAELADVERFVALDHGLAVVATSRADGSVQSSVVNAGVVCHPVDGTRVVAFVTYGAVKLAHLRARPRATLTFRAGWQWITVEGPVQLAGPDDALVDPEALRLLLRGIFIAAGGTHDDWDDYDRTMVSQRRAAVLVAPDRVYGS